MRTKVSLAVLLFVFLMVGLGAGCSSTEGNNDAGISEISLSNGGGQMNYWYRITFRNDGTAEYLGDVGPEHRGEPKPFGRSTKDTDRVRYRASLTRTQFENLAKLINGNGFFSMKENNDGVADAPQITTTVVRSGVRKEVRDQLGQGGEKLAEIDRAISRTADEIKWEKDLK